MRAGSPSLTAMFVAYARAVASHEATLKRACNDPFAERLLPAPWSSILRGALRSPNPQASMRALRLASFGLVDHVALRTALIDRALHHGLAQQTTQVVVLGAGFDARAHRIPALENATFFEVDHPSTQALKRKKAAGLPVAAKDLRYTPCDFERVSLDEALRTHGFDAGQKTLFIWEGVTMYLPQDAVTDSLRRISSISAKGSTLVATYMTPEITVRARFLAKLGVAGLAMVQEPIRSAFAPAAMQRLLSGHGFSVTEDALPAEVSTQLGIPNPFKFVATPSEHVVVASKHS